ncbi:MAG TPA: hypothetical protein VFI01_03820 [Gaiellaceae bacterium]|nr:hypothetical protein [Gaiellaceae bacterium]
MTDLETPVMDEHDRDAPSASASVVACSLCLRVRHGSSWIEAHQALRELRTSELAAPVRLEPGLCDRCLELVVRRRGNRARDRLRSGASASVGVHAPRGVRRRVS